jgi:putative redox protein
VITGKGLPAAQVERAIKLAKDKYCSASAMMAKTAEIDWDYEIREG